MTPEQLWTLRAGQSSARGAIDRRHLSNAVTDNPAFVGRVVAKPTVPTTMGVFFTVNPVAVSGKEREGGAGTLVVNSGATVEVYVVGSKAPVAGDDLVCRFVNNRWVAERMALRQTRPGYEGCPCGDLADTLQMTSSAPGSNYGTLQSSALVYGPTPSWASILSIPPQAYISPGTFTDQLAPNSPFYYVFLCYLGTYGVLRIFETSPYGSPFRDVFRYQWVPGVVGNSCSPLLLAQGSIYPGGDPSCVVTISE